MIERLTVDGSFWNAPFSHACRAGEFVFLTGQMPIDPATGSYVADQIVPQTRRVMENLRIVLDTAGLNLSDVVSARAFLTEMEQDYDSFNQVYAEYMGDHLPVRTCIGVTALAGGARVEIDFIAYAG